MNNKIKASSITGAGVFAVMFLMIIFSQAGDNPVGYCEATQEICIAVDGFSSGSQTRCYNETNMDWWDAPYCKEGWQIVENDLPSQNETEPFQKYNKGMGQTIKCNKNGCEEIK